MDEIKKRVLDSLSGLEFAIAAVCIVIATVLWFVIGAKNKTEKKKIIRQMTAAGIPVVIGTAVICILHFKPPKRFPPPVTGILVLKINGDSDGSLQSELVSSLNSELAKDSTDRSIEVRACDEVIDEKQGLEASHQQARDIGGKRNARLVVWGTKVGGSRFFARITVIRARPDYGERTLTVQDVSQLNLPVETIDQPLYFAHIVTGCSCFTQRRFEMAINHFEHAHSLNQATPDQLAESQLWMGLTHIMLSKDRMDYLTNAVKELAFSANYFLKSNTVSQDSGNYAIAEAGLGSLYWMFGTSESMPRAVTAFESAIRTCSETNYSLVWAYAQDNLGVAYLDLQTGNKAENVTNAIEAFHAALRVYIRKDYPAGWGQTLADLGNAYIRLPGRDHNENIRRAISASQLALTVLTQTNFPVEWASAVQGLGLALSELSTGNREENLRNAVNCYQAALQVRTKTEFPFDWANTQFSLGAAYNDLLSGDITSNLNQSITAITNGLTFFTKTDFPLKWAKGQARLATAYSLLPNGDRVGNLLMTIQCCSNALEVYNEEEYPQEWAGVQVQLAYAYQISGVVGSRAESLQSAIVSFEAASRVFTEKDFPLEWAEIEKNLGYTYGLVDGGFQKIIDHLQSSLRVITIERNELEWSQIQFHLATAYGSLRTGDPRENFLQSKDCLLNALKIMTPENSPTDYPIAIRDLGLIQENLKKIDRSKYSLGLPLSSP